MADFNIIIPNHLKQKPTCSEYLIAEIVADFFESNIYFIEPSIIRAPDIYVSKTRKTWEIKNIRGNSKRTIANNLRSAKYQSSNVIISLLNTQMTSAQAKSRITSYLKSGPSGIKKILIITKSKKVIALP